MATKTRCVMLQGVTRKQDLWSWPSVFCGLSCTVRVPADARGVSHVQKSILQPPLCKYRLRPKIWFALNFSSFIWEVSSMFQVTEAVAKVSIFWALGSSQRRVRMQTLAILCWKESVFSQAWVSFSFFCQQYVICYYWCKVVIREHCSSVSWSGKGNAGRCWCCLCFSGSSSFTFE